MARFSPSLFGGWRAALLLTTVVLCASSGRATAACGDHVTILNTEAKDGGTALPNDGVPSPAPRPCQGPNCSGVPERHTPPSAPAPSAGPQVKEVAHPAEHTGQPDERPRLSVDDLTSLRPIDVGSSIFHPPRVG